MENIDKLIENWVIEEILPDGSEKLTLIEPCNVRWEGPFNDAKDDAETYCGDCDYNLDEGAEDWNYCPMCGLKLVYRDVFGYADDIQL